MATTDCEYDAETIYQWIGEEVTQHRNMVSISAISAQFQLNVDKCREKLKDFIEKVLSKDEDLSKKVAVKYLVSGFDKGDHTTVHRFSLVSKEDLEHAKAKLTSVDSCWPYSVEPDEDWINGSLGGSPVKTLAQRYEDLESKGEMIDQSLLEVNQSLSNLVVEGINLRTKSIVTRTDGKKEQVQQLQLLIPSPFKKPSTDDSNNPAANEETTVRNGNGTSKTQSNVKKDLFANARSKQQEKPKPQEQKEEPVNIQDGDFDSDLEWDENLKEKNNDKEEDSEPEAPKRATRSSQKDKKDTNGHCSLPEGSDVEPEEEESCSESEEEKDKSESEEEEEEDESDEDLIASTKRNMKSSAASSKPTTKPKSPPPKAKTISNGKANGKAPAKGKGKKTPSPLPFNDGSDEDVVVNYDSSSDEELLPKTARKSPSPPPRRKPTKQRSPSRSPSPPPAKKTSKYSTKSSSDKPSSKLTSVKDKPKSSSTKRKSAGDSDDESDKEKASRKPPSQEVIKKKAPEKQEQKNGKSAGSAPSAAKKVRKNEPDPKKQASIMSFFKPKVAN